MITRLFTRNADASFFSETERGNIVIEFFLSDSRSESHKYWVTGISETVSYGFDTVTRSLRTMNYFRLNDHTSRTVKGFGKAYQLFFKSHSKGENLES